MKVKFREIRHGSTSWEVDALRPDVLNQILEDEILEQIDEDIYLDVVSREDADKDRLRNLKKYLNE